jgi:endonuclease I
MEQWYHYLISLNGSKLGSSSVAGYSGTVFEPIDEFKGDIARISTLRPAMKPLFLVTHILSTEQPIRYSQLPFEYALAWNTQDPVNAREIA